MIEAITTNSILVISIAIFICSMLLALGATFGHFLSKRRYSLQITELESHVLELENELSTLQLNHNALKQEQAGMKYELGKLQRDNAHLESRLKS